MKGYESMDGAQSDWNQWPLGPIEYENWWTERVGSQASANVEPSAHIPTHRLQYLIILRTKRQISR